MVAPLPRRIPGRSRVSPGNLLPRSGPLPGFAPSASPSSQPDSDRVIEPDASRPEPPGRLAAGSGPSPSPDGQAAAPAACPGPPGQGESAPAPSRSEPPGQDGGAPETSQSQPPAQRRSEPEASQHEPPGPDEAEPGASRPAPSRQTAGGLVAAERGDPDEPVTGPIVLRPHSEPERRAAQPLASRTGSDVAPSWGTVAGTTVRLWVQRRRTGWRVAAAIVVALVVFAAGGLTVALLRKGGAPGSPSGSSSSAGVQAATAARKQAAAWVAAQVSPTAVVSCDPAMCAALQARGFPAGDLMTLAPGTNNPLGSAIIVATAAVRSLFGSRLTTVYAPSVIASFGSGSARIDVRVYAAGGAPVYLAALKADELSRISVGRQLLRNSRVSATPAARRQLVTGQVDSRLLITIATLSGQGPVSIAAFGDSGPGASPGAPLREAEMVAPAKAKSGYLRSMISLLHAQQQPYLANSVTLVRLANGQQAVRIEFAAPSPLGLLSG